MRLALTVLILGIVAGTIARRVMWWAQALSDDPAGQVERDERRALRKRPRKVYHLNDPATARSMIRRNASS